MSENDQSMVHSARLLLVADEQMTALPLQGPLSAQGYTVETEVNGRTGYQRATHEQFDLIILDLLLPLMSGLEICHRLRQNGLQTPVLILSGLNHPNGEMLIRDFGADDYLIRPFALAELLARVEKLLNRSLQMAAGAKGELRPDCR
ncbi:MAG: response regulator [Blastocatellia bacterium]